MNTNCRACDSDNLFTAIDLGEQPLAGGFVTVPGAAYKDYETKLLICSDCGLGQLSLDVPPEELYSEYNWRTSTSKSYLDYIWDFADHGIIPYLDTNEDWVLEIGSNDGYLLKYLQDEGYGVLGVDPAKNISAYAIASGVPIIVDFFSADVARNILELKGYPKRIIANNVAAHTPDIKSFMEGISILSGPDTITTIENPTIMNILTKGQFDTIFHEHYSYLSAKAVDSLADRYGLTLFSVEHVSPQGGSNRYWLEKDVKKLTSVYDTIKQEEADGLTDQQTWSEYDKELTNSLKKFHAYLATWDRGSVCGFGASAKASAVLNSKRRPGDKLKILAVADDVKEKQGTYFPKDQIPIISTEKMLHLKPDSVLIFAWNIKDELEVKLKNLGYTGKVWTWLEVPPTH
jgi:SAM-dependent methyltransferase